MNTPKITVAIATYQREEVLVDTIRDVLKQDFESFELIVVDQTKNHEETTLRSLNDISDPRFRYFSVTPPSLPAARNFAIEKSQSDIVLFIDDDVQLTSNFIEAHYNTHISRPDIKAVAGRVAHGGQAPSEKLFTFNWYGEERGGFNYPHSREALSFLGCNFSIKKEIFEEIGFFDTNFHDSSMREESEMAVRIIKAGYRIWYESNAQLVHLIANSGGCRIYEIKRDNQSYYKNDLYYTLKTVSFFLLPIVLAAKLNRYVICRPLNKLGVRGYLFVRGLEFAIKRRLRPNKITSKVLSKNRKN